MSKPIVLYSDKAGPNSWKVAMILEELGLKYETKVLDWATELKVKPYTDKNPNGRVPTIGAIIEYLIKQYDTSAKLSYTSFPEEYHCKQFLYFQASGQGPYFGQAAWFTNFHPEKIPSAVERYKNEIKRVAMVLNNALEGKEYLVGDKCTYTDLSFVTWANAIPFSTGDDTIDVINKDYPNYAAWMQRLTTRPVVKKVIEANMKALSN